MFDTDFGFNLDYPYVQGAGMREQHNTLSFAIDGANVSWPNPDWSVQMLRGALRNVSFRHSFINRFADLLNTAFSPERVEAEIDAIYNQLKPHMPEHVNRWRGPETMQEWEDEVASMRDFARKRPAVQREHILSHFRLRGSVDVTLDVNDHEGGHIRINTIDIQPGKVGIPDHPWPWSGVYFHDVPVTITAVPAVGYEFAGWEGCDHAEETVTIRTFEQELSLKALFEATDVSAGLSETEPDRPRDFQLHPPRPNPFNNRTMVTVAVPDTGHLRVSVYSVDGRRVAVLVDGVVRSGFHEVAVDASAWASGIYIVTAESRSRRMSVPITLVK